MLENTTRYLLTVTTTVCVLAGLGLLVSYFYTLTALLGIVLIITYMLLGPVNLMQHGIEGLSRQMGRLPVYGNLVRQTPDVNSRVLAVLIVYFAFFMLLTLGGIQSLPLLGKQLGEFSVKMTSQVVLFSDKAIDWADQSVGQGTIRQLFAKDILQAEQEGLVKTHSPEGKPVTAEEKQVIQQSVIQTTVNQLEHALVSALPNFISLVGGTLNGLVYFLVGLLLTFYFLTDSSRIQPELMLLFPAQARPTVSYLLTSFHQVMFAFIKGQVLLGLLTGGYMFIVYSVFHVPYAFLLGCLFAVAELLPVVGTWIGISVGLMVILFNMDPIIALWVWLCSYSYQTIKDNILAPKVVGDVMGLHPLVIILALLVCAKVAGLLGVLLALPLASAINVILRLLLKKDQDAKAQQLALSGKRGDCAV